MELPKNARVVVVDNELDEVSDLLACLAKQGVAALYFKDAKDFPVAPLTGVRLLFLDLELNGLKGQSNKNKASAAAANFSKLISQNNGPLVVVLWTKHDELEKSVVKNILAVAKKRPVYISCLAKADCKDGEHFSIELIQANLYKTIEKFDIVGLYISWENAIDRATVRQSCRFSDIATTGGEWSEQMSYALYRLFMAYSEKDKGEPVNQQISSAWQLYRDCFLSELSGALNDIVINTTNGFKLSKSLSSTDVMNKIKGKINATLLYSIKSCPVQEPGSVYLVNNDCSDKRLSMLKESISLDFSKPSNKCPLTDPAIRLCKILITPQCDLAQNKLMHLEDGKQFNRIVWGLFIQGKENTEWLVEKQYGRCYSEYTNFEYKGNQCALLIDLDTVEIDMSPLDESSRLFVLNPIPLTDIQTKAANQLNRVGVSVAD